MNRYINKWLSLLLKRLALKETLKNTWHVVLNASPMYLKGDDDIFLFTR